LTLVNVSRMAYAYPAAIEDLTLHEQDVASAVDPGWPLSTVISGGAGRYEPVRDDQIVVAQLLGERLKRVLDAEASLEVLRPRLQLRSYGQP
jgi:hypothetical protein